MLLLRYLLLISCEEISIIVVSHCIEMNTGHTCENWILCTAQCMKSGQFSPFSQAYCMQYHTFNNKLARVCPFT